MSTKYKEKLIDLVKLNPALWRQSRKAPGLKQKIWDEIGTELGTNAYDARRQWEILRDQLRRETKRYKQNPQYKSKWMFYKRMLFTVPANETAPTGCSDDGEQYHSDHQQIMQNANYSYLTPKTEDSGQSTIKVRRDLQDSNDDQSQSASVDGFCPETPPMTTVAAAAVTAEDYYPSTSAAGVTSSTQRPRYTEEDVDLKRRIRTKRYPVPVPACHQEDDEDYYFALSLVPSLRCIPGSRKLRIRSKIMDLIANALEEEDTNVGFSRADDDNDEFEEKIIHQQMVETSMDIIN